jgi:HD-GYP domain-containing protein (c-di-GMP phosphodiesterase class II)
MNTDFDFFSQELALSYYTDDQEIIRSGESLINREEPTVDPDGNQRWLLTTKVPLRDNSGKIIGIVGINRDITERRQAEERIRSQLNRLAALHTIDMAITGSTDLRILLDILLEQAVAQLRVDAVDVLIYNPLSMTMDYITGSGFHTNALKHSHLRLGEGHAGRAVLDRHIIYIPDLSKEPDASALASKLSGERFITYFAVPLIVKGSIKGVLEVFHRELLEPDQEWLDYLETMAGQAAIAIDNVTLFNDLQRSNVDLMRACDATIEGWSHALDMRDKETEGHTQRVTEITLRLAHAMGVGEAELVHIRRGALLHDIGKLGVPDNILLKPDSFTDDEWEIMRQHPIYAYEMLSPITYLHPALDIPYCHHEKWDGSGYPRGLKGEQIPLAARLFAVVDVWDALRSDRPYLSAWSEEKTLEYINAESGKYFDPQVVKVFERMIGEG